MSTVRYLATYFVTFIGFVLESVYLKKKYISMNRSEVISLSTAFNSCSQTGKTENTSRLNRILWRSNFDIFLIATTFKAIVLANY